MIEFKLLCRLWTEPAPLAFVLETPIQEIYTLLPDCGMTSVRVSRSKSSHLSLLITETRGDLLVLTKRILENRETLFIIFKARPADFLALEGNSFSANDLCPPLATQQHNRLKIGFGLIEDTMGLIPQSDNSKNRFIFLFLFYFFSSCWVEFPFNLIASPQPLDGRLARKYKTGKDNVKKIVIGHKSEKDNKNIRKM